jgi:hypothetical protein
VPEDLLPSRAPTLVPPPLFVGPNLFNPPAPQGWLTITPSFTLGVTYDDNIFLDDRNRRSDFIVGFTPGVTASIRRPGFSLLAGYNVTGQVFIKETDLSDFGKEQNFFTDLVYELSPAVTFTLSDQFIYDRDSNAITGGGVSVGRRDAFRNTITPQLRWQATQSTGVSLVGSYTLIRFSGGTEGGSSSSQFLEEDSDTYRIGLGLDRRLTARLTGLLNFDVGYFNFQHESSAWTYTPTVGATYDFTPTLRATLIGGATILERSGDTAVSPAIRATARQLFKFGTVQIGYDRSVAAASIGLSEVQSIYGSLAVPTLMRGLSLSFTPRYTIVDTDVSGSNSSSNGTAENQTVRTLALTLGGVYQIARNISLIGSYTFFQQTTTQRNFGDIDQNRVYLGIQYAFPINFY